MRVWIPTTVERRPEDTMTTLAELKAGSPRRTSRSSAPASSRCRSATSAASTARPACWSSSPAACPTRRSAADDMVVVVARRRAVGRGRPPAVDRHADPPAAVPGAGRRSAASSTPTRARDGVGPGRAADPVSRHDPRRLLPGRGPGEPAAAAGRDRRRLRVGDRARVIVETLRRSGPDGRGFARGAGRVSRSVRLGAISGSRRRGGDRPRGDRADGAPDAADRGVDDGDRGRAAGPGISIGSTARRPTTGSRRPRRTGRMQQAAAATRHAPRPIGPPEPCLSCVSSPVAGSSLARSRNPTRSPARSWSV